MVLRNARQTTSKINVVAVLRLPGAWVVVEYVGDETVTRFDPGETAEAPEELTLPPWSAANLAIPGASSMKARGRRRVAAGGGSTRTRITE
jgi:hypothetical protein